MMATEKNGITTSSSSSSVTATTAATSATNTNINSAAATGNVVNNNSTNNNNINDSDTPSLPMPGCFKNVSDRVLKAKIKLLESSYDLDAWNVLIKDSQNKPVETVRDLYEQLVSYFPTSGRFWKLYIEMEIKHRNYERVEKLFGRCLVKVLNIDLWKCYLNYVKETKFGITPVRDKVGQAFDFAIDKMGIDINSYSIYSEYVQFLKSSDVVGSYAENQRISAVRRIYQRGIVIPMSNIELFWKDYLAYEQSINQMFVEKAISDRSKDYMNARRVAKEFEAITRGLNRNAPAVPPQSTPEETRQVELWKRYLAWEKSNPLKSEDHSLVIKRVKFAYEQCLLCLGHHPDIWYEYASYLEQNSKLMADKGDMNHHKALQEDVANVYERATSTLLKENVLLHFSYADFEESRNRKEEASKIYEKLLKIQTPEFNPTLVYIQYMKFTRRTESITSARAIFKRGREDTRSGSELYTAAALMEYYCSKDINIACKIFELGLKKFPLDSNFVLSYIDFLSHLNEENNIRVLFERVLSNDALPPEKSLEIWNRFLEFEAQIGDLPSVIKVEKRRLNVIEKLQRNFSETSWLVDRYKFAHLMPCTSVELRSIGYLNKLHTANNVSGGCAIGGIKHNNSTVSGSTSLDGQPATPRKSRVKQFLPNLNQMVPYKPVVNPVGNLKPGGVYPYPPSITALMSILPPPISFRGPFVNIDELMSIYKSCTSISLTTDSNGTKGECLLPSDAKSYFQIVLDASESTFANIANSGNSGGGGGGGGRIDGPSNTGTSSAIGTSGSGGSGAAAGNHKRQLQLDEEDDDDSNLMPPQFDIYRSRQLQKKPRN